MTDAKVDVYLPLFVGDYLADTTDLTAEEHGVYLLLLMDLWKREGRLPTDPVRLARIARLDFARWESVWATVSRFFELEDGSYIQGRLTREMDRAKARKTAASKNGRAGGLAKSKQTASETPGKPPSETVADSSSSSPSPSSSGEEIRSDPLKPPKGGRVKVSRASRIEYPEDFERFWGITNQLGSKAKAFAHWERFGRPPPDELVPRWKRWQQTDQWRRGFEKHPEFWFSGRMHEQDPPLGGARAIRGSSPAEQIQAMQAKEREEREYRRRSDEAADEIAAQVEAALREAEAAVNS